MAWVQSPGGVGEDEVRELGAKALAVEEESKKHSGDAYGERLNEAMDEGVKVAFIGNSMLNCRVDQRVLDELWGENTGAVLGKGNSFSAIWLVALERLLASEQRPEKVVIFFRDRFLTWPEFRLEGENLRFLQELMGEESFPVVEAYFPGAEGEDEGLIDLCERWLVGLETPSEKGVDRVEDWAFDLTKLENDKGQRRDLMNLQFSLANLRKDLPSDLGMELSVGNEVQMDGFSTPELFSLATKDSFLPVMVDLAQQKGVELVFWRVQRRPEGEQNVEAQQLLDRYLGELQRYVEGEGMKFFDENGVSPVGLEDYADGDHIGLDVRDEYTRWMVKRLARMDVL